MLNKLLRINKLMDVYANLLTEKQRLSLEMHYFDDLSLSEISTELEISRQAVHDSIHRGESLMEEYESKLGVLKKDLHTKLFLNEILIELNMIKNKKNISDLDKIIQKLANYVNEGKEE